jgi:hypothetical protein
MTALNSGATRDNALCGAFEYVQCGYDAAIGMTLRTTSRVLLLSKTFCSTRPSNHAARP